MPQEQEQPQVALQQALQQENQQARMVSYQPHTDERPWELIAGALTVAAAAGLALARACVVVAFAPTRRRNRRP